MSRTKHKKTLLEDDDQTALDHIEVRDYTNVRKRSKTRKFFDHLLGATLNTSDAIDDSYSVFSSFASHGLTLSKHIFFLLGAILTFNYFFVARSRQRDSRKAFEQSLRYIGDRIIPQSQYSLWETQLQQLGCDDLSKNIEKTVKNAYADDLLQYVNEEVQHADQLLREFIHDLDKNAPNKNKLLKNQLDTIQFIHGQLALSALETASKIKKNPNIKNTLEKIPQPLTSRPTWRKKIQTAVRNLRRSILFNYVDIFAGIGLSGTFSSIVLSFTGTGIVAQFPWNIILALSFVAITALGSFLTKRYFRKRIKLYNESKKNLNASIANKRVLMDLLINTKQYRSQLNLAIQEYKLIRNEILDITESNTTEEALLREELANRLASVDDNNDSQEHVEVIRFKSKSQLFRHALGFTLPTIFAISSGYSVGATLLQLTLFAGIGTSLLPFIVIGLICIIFFSTNALRLTYKNLQLEQEKLLKLNNEVISPTKIEVLENRLKLTQRYGLQYKQQTHSVGQYVKRLTAPKIAQALLLEIEAMRIQFKSAKNTDSKIFDKDLLALLNQIQTQLIDRLTLQAQNLNSQKLASNLRLKLRGIEPLNEDTVKQKISYKNRFISLIKGISQFLHRNLRSALDGICWGLSTSASFLLIFGTASLLSFSTTIAILVTGAMIGILFALTNRYFQEYRLTYHQQRKAVKATIRDKGVLAEMLVQTLQARDQVNLLIETSYHKNDEAQPEYAKIPRSSYETVYHDEFKEQESLFSKSSIMPQQRKKHPDLQHTMKKIRAQHLVNQLAQSLTVTLHSGKKESGSFLPNFVSLERHESAFTI